MFSAAETPVQKDASSRSSESLDLSLEANVMWLESRLVPADYLTLVLGDQSETFSTVSAHRHTVNKAGEA